jgi:serine/threonine protein kinase/dipeptidyl aminopeptidase/acylaminoacyl peptidase
MERWQQIESLFQEALERDPAERNAWLREACQGDSDLRREVASLLANHQAATDSQPWVAAAAAKLIDGSASLKPGQCLGPYRIESFVAAGGMGEVYRATDTRLNRTVAVKLSAGRFSERFEREARVIASLNHPNICTLYDVGPNYLVMEYVEGPTLSERIQQGPIPLAEGLEIARQMAAALEEAHQRMVVHRDFKPGNVKIKPDHTVKVLDFGLAKLPAMQTGAGANATDSPTLTMAATQAGVLLGTAAYMSPEQARGEAVDKRGDVWAFGVVLWEMLTGKRLFDGKTTSDVLAAVIRDEPDLSRVPAKVRPLLKRCLEKDPQRRLRDIGDAMGIIESTSEAIKAPSRLVRTLAPVAALFLVTSIALAFLLFHGRPANLRVISTSINPPENTAFDNYSLSLTSPALSADGRWIVFRARGVDGKRGLWVRQLQSTVAQPLAGTEDAVFPFWSPDSHSIGFFADGNLKRMDIAGGPITTLAGAPLPWGGSWSPQNVIVFAPKPNGPLLRVAAVGGVPSAATTLEPGGLSHHLPWFLPDGRHFLFADQKQPGNDVMLRIGALDSAEIETIGPANSAALYSSGYLLYLRQNTLMAQPFDENRRGVTGQAQPLVEQVVRWIQGPTGLALVSVAGEGLLVYQAGLGVSQRQLTWFDRSGKPMGTLGEPGSIFSVEFSPDGKRVALTLGEQNSDIWVYDIARRLPTRVTVGTAAARDPIWIDGRNIVYTSNAKGSLDLYRKAVDGTEDDELLYADDGASKVPTSWWPDGRFLLYQRLDPKTGQEIWVLPVGVPSGSGAPPKPFRWLGAPFSQRDARFSPDGHWLAYTSNLSGRFEIYVAPFPKPGRRYQISNNGGRYPRWQANGKQIFYVLNGTLMAADVAIKPGAIEPGPVRSLGIPVPDGFYPYDVSADGQRFLVAAAREQKSPTALTLVENWAALLKKK